VEEGVMEKRKVTSAVLVKTSVVLHISGIHTRDHQRAIVEAVKALNKHRLIERLLTRTSPFPTGDGFYVDFIEPTKADFEYGVEQHSGSESDVEVTWYSPGDPREDVRKKCGHACDLVRHVHVDENSTAPACPNCEEVL
jgi:hypothetical protein